MINFIIVMARSYPFWATPLSISFLGAAIVLTKKKHKSVGLYCGAIGLFFATGVALYVFFDGYAKIVPLIHEYLVTSPEIGPKIYE